MRSLTKKSSLTALLAIALSITASAYARHQLVQGQEGKGHDKGEGLSENNTDAGGAIEVELKDQNQQSRNQESTEVILALEQLLKSLGQRNLDQISECLSPDVTTFDHTHKVVFGKDAVLQVIKTTVIGETKTSPVKRITLYDPFVDIKGDTAMVSFRATKQMVSNHFFESWCSEIYERKNGRWLVLQFHTDWKSVHSGD